MKKTNQQPRPVKLSTILRKLGAFCKIENLPSARLALLGGGGEQYVAKFKNGEIMQSYRSVVGVKLYDGGKLYLTPYHDYSRTTMAYCGRWCGMDVHARRKALKKGEIRLAIA